MEQSDLFNSNSSLIMYRCKYILWFTVWPSSGLSLRKSPRVCAACKTSYNNKNTDTVWL